MRIHLYSFLTIKNFTVVLLMIQPLLSCQYLQISSLNWLICALILMYLPSQSTFYWPGGNSVSSHLVFFCTLIQSGKRGEGLISALAQLQLM